MKNTFELIIIFGFFLLCLTERLKPIHSHCDCCWLLHITYDDEEKKNIGRNIKCTGPNRNTEQQRTNAVCCAVGCVDVTLLISLCHTFCVCAEKCAATEPSSAQKKLHENGQWAQCFTYTMNRKEIKLIFVS